MFLLTFLIFVKMFNNKKITLKINGGYVFIETLFIGKSQAALETDLSCQRLKSY